MTPSVSAAPRLLVIAGPNGSGKTTLTNRLRAMGLDFGEYINADEIALSLPKTGNRDRLAQLEADRRRAAALREGRSYSFETVMSHPSKIDEMRAARTAGYHLTFIGVALQDPSLNVQRVAVRVREGGHDVPTDRIIARYHRTLFLMPEAISLADRSLVFDNSDNAAGPQLCLSVLRRKPDRLSSPLTVRVARSVDRLSTHWVATSVLDRLRRMGDEGRLVLHFGPLLP